MSTKPILLGGVEAGGTKFICGVAAADGVIINQIRIPTTSPDETLDAVAAFFVDAQSRYGRLRRCQSSTSACASKPEIYGPGRPSASTALTRRLYCIQPYDKLCREIGSPRRLAVLKKIVAAVAFAGSTLVGIPAANANPSMCQQQYEANMESCGIIEDGGALTACWRSADAAFQECLKRDAQVYD